MDRVTSSALACVLVLACGGDPEPSIGTDQSAGGAAPASGNRPPAIDSLVLEPSEPRPGQIVTARASATDPEDDRITLDYRWSVAGVPVEGANGKPSFQVESKGRGTSIEVTVIARDEHGESSPLSAQTNIANLPPAIHNVDLTPAPPISAGHDLTAVVTAADQDGDAIEYRYVWSVNDQTAAVDGATLPASEFKRGDRIVLEVVASDGQRESEALTTAPIEVVNAPPKILSKPGAIGDDGVFRYAVQAEDPDGDRVLRWRLAKAPAGMTIGFDDGKINWEVPSHAAGSHDIEVEVEDRFGAKAKQDFALEVSFSDQKSAKEGAAKTDAPADSGGDS